MSKILLVTWCLVFGLFSTCFGAIKYDAHKVDLEDANGYLLFRYPVFHGDTPEEKAVVAKMNNTLHQLALNETVAIQKTWNAPSDNAKANFKSKDVDYTVTLLDANLASMVFTTTFAEGSRDALFFKDGWTFDLTTGAPVGWSSLVKPEDKYQFNKSNVIRLLQQGAKQGDYVLYWDFNGMKGVPDNYYVGSNGNIHLLFNPYDVSPYSAGVIDLDTNCLVKYQ
jgi:hypothetical protein